ncbi:MAG: hypothetical protein JO133_06970 [Burkholderiaceae bacterium]|nr:hypothetical protein [Burkholderiaceae bacterium]
MLSDEDLKIVQLLLRVPPADLPRVLDVIRAISVSPAYIREREDCLQRLGLR